MPFLTSRSAQTHRRANTVTIMNHYVSDTVPDTLHAKFKITLRAELQVRGYYFYFTNKEIGERELKLLVHNHGASK